MRLCVRLECAGDLFQQLICRVAFTQTSTHTLARQL